jgi:hypothetical protein
MYANIWRRQMRTSSLLIVSILSAMVILTCVKPAQAIPVFSRKYQTSCITCHAGYPKLNAAGEAFRRNGYQFPSDDEFLVKDEPIPLGNDRYKDMWPNSLWPNDIPHLPPVAMRVRMGYNQFLDKQSGAEQSSDFQFPNDVSLLSGGTLGKDISWYGSLVLAGAGAHGAGGHGGDEERTLAPDLERVFVQFSNLFAWSSEEDDDGMHLAPRWLALPRHAMNLRIGQFEPQVVAPWRSIHRQIGTTAYLPNIATVGGNGFTLEPAQRGLELHGTIRQNNSYAIGLVNGNGAEAAWDNNSQKDVYFRVARKWFGYPLDGVIGQADYVEEGDTALATIRGQDDAEAFAPLGLDFWRELQFETGFFGYFGRNQASVTTVEDFTIAGVDGMGIPVALDYDVSTTTTRPNRFDRIGFDARFQYRDLDVFGAWMWGQDNDPISDEDPLTIESDRLFTWFVEADYYFKPWLIGYARYEQLNYANDERQAEAGIARGVTGVSAYIRANMRLVSEVVMNAHGNPTTNDTANFLLDFAY